MGNSTGWLERLKSSLGLIPTKDYTKVSITCKDENTEESTHFVYLNDNNKIYIESVYTALHEVFSKTKEESYDTAMHAQDNGKALAFIAISKKSAEELADKANIVLCRHQTESGYGDLIPNDIKIFTVESSK